MLKYSEEDKKKLLILARKAIEEKFSGIKPGKLEAKKFSEKRGVFVTLNKNKELRGCIGFPYPYLPVQEAVISAAKSAAFSDPRFFPVQEKELKEIKMEISILTIPEKLNYKDEKDLLKKINHNLGIIIKKGFYQAIYLPQVWEQIPDKQQFLSSLCMKAGLPSNSWKEKIEIYIYKVEKIKEN